jgi:carbonic anhydrase
MNTIDEVLQYNDGFVAEKRYEQYQTDKYPEKKLAVISCMDTRLTELLPAALGLKNGDAKIIKNAGGVIAHPFGSVVRSLLVAIFELGVENIMVVGHSNCGAQHMNAKEMISHMLDAGVPRDHIELMHYCGIDFENWLAGFGDGEESVRETVHLIQHHPLIPESISVRGFIIDSTTGKLSEVDCSPSVTDIW